MYYDLKDRASPDPRLPLLKTGHYKRNKPQEKDLTFATPKFDQAHRIFANLCLVNQSWHDAARPWLWRDVRVNIPRYFLKIIYAVSGQEDRELEKLGTRSSSRGRPISPTAIETVTEEGHEGTDSTYPTQGTSSAIAMRSSSMSRAASSHSHLGRSLSPTRYEHTMRDRRVSAVLDDAERRGKFSFNTIELYI